MPRAKSTSKNTISVNTKPKTRAKPKVTTKAKKTKTVVKSKAKSKKPVSHPVSHIEYNDKQTWDLLAIVEQIVDSRKHKQGGVKSFYLIDKILDKYNQHYTHPIEKLAAIVKYGVEKDPAVVHAHFFIAIDNRSKEENDLYKVLTEIGKGKMTYEDAKVKMNHILAESSK